MKATLYLVYNLEKINKFTINLEVFPPVNWGLKSEEFSKGVVTLK